jgi:hypothetical protein
MSVYIPADTLAAGGQAVVDGDVNDGEKWMCRAYSYLKESLAQQYRLDPPGYNDAKSMFIQEIDRKAAAWWQERCEGD